MPINESVNMLKNDRLEYIDVARGIAIILMIIGHVLLDGWKRDLIYSFHMPFFIILSGMLYKNRGFKDTVLNILKKLVIPYILCAFITDIIISEFDIRNTFNVWLKQILYSYTYWSKITFDNSAMRLETLWFFPLLAIIKLIFYILKKIFKENNLNLFFASSLLMYIGYLLGENGFWLPFSFDVALVAVFFYFIGYIITKKNVLNILINDKAILILSIIIWMLGIRYNSIELATRTYNNTFFSVLTALCGSLITLKVSCIIVDKTNLVKKILMWYGKNSIYVLLLHHLERSLFNYNVISNQIKFEWIFESFVSFVRIYMISIVIFFVDVFKNVVIKDLKSITNADDMKDNKNVSEKLNV